MTSILKVDTIQDTTVITLSTKVLIRLLSVHLVIQIIGPSGATLNVAGTLQSGGSALVTGKVLQVVAGTDNSF